MLAIVVNSPLTERGFEASRRRLARPGSNNLSVNACLLFLPRLVVPAPTTTFQCVFGRLRTSDGANPPP